ncbi:curli-like amyloid fiber formation chaperone CsgH [Falsihalocynthiibacter arcticus]|nr:curli-like amyloid fiber formation chaperone CsgH [Falsihalocynthiibacter arcticus]
MSQTEKSALGEVQTESSSGKLHCEITTKTVSQNLQLRGVVWSGDKAAGSYSFVVTKQGVSGRSNIAQSGLFDVAPDERKIVGMVIVNALAGDRYLARLSVRSGGNEAACDTTLD